MRQTRRTVRRHLLYYLQVLDRDTKQPVGRLGDLSGEGLMLLCETPPQVGREYHLRVMPPEVASDEQPLDVDAECIWCRRDVNPDLRLAGFRFATVDEATRRSIDVLVREHGFSDGQFLVDDEEE